MLLVLALRSPATRCDPRRHQRRLDGGETQAAHGMACTAYGRRASIAFCTAAMTSPASEPIIVKPRMRSSPATRAFMNPCENSTAAFIELLTTGAAPEAPVAPGRSLTSFRHVRRVTLYAPHCTVLHLGRIRARRLFTRPANAGAKDDTTWATRTTSATWRAMCAQRPAYVCNDFDYPSWARADVGSPATGSSHTARMNEIVGERVRLPQFLGYVEHTCKNRSQAFQARDGAWVQWRRDIRHVEEIAPEPADMTPDVGAHAGRQARCDRVAVASHTGEHFRQIRDV